MKDRAVAAVGLMVYLPPLVSTSATRRCWPRCILFLLLIGVAGAGIKGCRNATGSRQSVNSAVNLRELGGCLMRYANDHSGNFPNRISDLVRAEPDLSPELFIVEWGSATPATSPTPEGRSAEIDAGGHCSYGYLAAGRTERDITRNSVLMFENDGTHPTGGIFCLFGDGHGELLPVPQAIAAVVATLREPTAANPPSTAATTQP